ncbi:MAG: hypothetical protein ACE15C_12605 [Phycisphaerae bacterium]
MKRLTTMLLGAALMAAWTVPALAQNAVSEQKKAQNKLLAQRAARADAMRKLAERIYGLHITSETTVKDFVAESDKIQTAMQAFLMGAEEVGQPKYMEDGTCSLTMKVTLQEIITELKKYHSAYYKGDKFKVNDFEKMTVTNTIKEIQETGTGAPRPEQNVGDVVVIREGETAESLDMPADAKAYWLKHCMPQGRLMAVRAAHVDALRKLAERIKGVQITSDTTVKDFVAEGDNIQTALNAFLKGARDVGLRYHNDELIVEVDVQVKLRTVLADIKAYAEEHYKGDTAKIKKIEEVTLKTQDTIVKETGSGVPPAKYLKDVPPAQVAVLETATKLPDWVGQTMRVKGSAALDADNPNKAQARLMAFRGAELDARRKIAEQLNGLVITSKTNVKDFVAQSDDIRTAMLTFQQGAHVVEGSQKLAEDGTATVEVEIELKPLWDMIVVYRSKGIKID